MMELFTPSLSKKPRFVIATARREAGSNPGIIDNKLDCFPPFAMTKGFLDTLKMKKERFAPLKRYYIPRAERIRRERRNGKAPVTSNSRRQLRRTWLKTNRVVLLYQSLTFREPSLMTTS
jgi:hypothetical protein